MMMMRLDETAARGYASSFRRFSNFDDEEIRLVLCALLQLYINNSLKLSRTAASMLFFMRTRRRKRA